MVITDLKNSFENETKALKEKITKRTKTKDQLKNATKDQLKNETKDKQKNATKDEQSNETKDKQKNETKDKQKNETKDKQKPETKDQLKNETKDKQKRKKENTALQHDYIPSGLIKGYRIRSMMALIFSSIHVAHIKKRLCVPRAITFWIDQCSVIAKMEAVARPYGWIVRTCAHWQRVDAEELNRFLQEEPTAQGRDTVFTKSPSHLDC